ALPATGSLGVPMQVEYVDELPAGRDAGQAQLVDVPVEEIAVGRSVWRVLKGQIALPAVAYGPEYERIWDDVLDRGSSRDCARQEFVIANRIGMDPRVRRGPEVRLIVEVVEQRGKTLRVHTGKSGFEKPHELVLVDVRIVQVRRIRKGGALGGQRDAKPHVQIVGGRRHIAAAELVRRDVTGHGDRDDGRGAGRERCRRGGANRLGGDVATSQISVVLVVPVRAGV